MAAVRNNVRRTVAIIRTRWSWASSWQRPCGRCTLHSGPVSVAPVSCLTRGHTARRSHRRSLRRRLTRTNSLLCARVDFVRLTRRQTANVVTVLVSFRYSKYLCWLEKTRNIHNLCNSMASGGHIYSVNVTIYDKLKLRQIAVFCNTCMLVCIWCAANLQQ